MAGLRDPSRLKMSERRSPGLLAETAEHGPGTEVELPGHSRTGPPLIDRTGRDTLTSQRYATFRRRDS
jgi:hypothetical protein